MGEFFATRDCVQTSSSLADKHDTTFNDVVQASMSPPCSVSGGVLAVGVNRAVGPGA